jgi:hypothetical protein
MAMYHAVEDDAERVVVIAVIRKTSGRIPSGEGIAP